MGTTLIILRLLLAVSWIVTVVIAYCVGINTGIKQTTEAVNHTLDLITEARKNLEHSKGKSDGEKELK